MSTRWFSDEELLRGLSEALREAREVPGHCVDAGKAAFVWRTIDAELAALTYDSAQDFADPDLLVVTRAEPAALRALTFAASELSIEMEVTDDALLGQLFPTQSAALEIQHANGVNDAVAIDEVGWFSVRPAPSGRFRLRCTLESGTTVVTGWIDV